MGRGAIQHVVVGITMMVIAEGVCADIVVKFPFGGYGSLPDPGHDLIGVVVLSSVIDLSIFAISEEFNVSLGGRGRSVVEPIVSMIEVPSLLKDAGYIGACSEFIKLSVGGSTSEHEALLTLPLIEMTADVNHAIKLDLFDVEDVATVSESSD